MTVLTLALILLGAVAVALAVALVQRAREIRRLRELGERVLAVAQSGDLAERLTPHAAAGSATDIADACTLQAEPEDRPRPGHPRQLDHADAGHHRR
jgi:hypothetical protein